MQAKSEFAHDGYQIDSKEKSAIDLIHQEELKAILNKEISRLPEGNAKRILILSVHEYFQANNSGCSPACATSSAG